MSRDKGARNERLLVKHLREKGYKATRVPLSGAAEGYKGDVALEIPSKHECYKVEVKTRRSSFARIYELYKQMQNTNVSALNSGAQTFVYDGDLVAISDDVEHALRAWTYHPYKDYSLDKTWERTFRKVRNMKSLLGEADILAIKDDRKPWLFIVY